MPAKATSPSSARTPTSILSPTVTRRWSARVQAMEPSSSSGLPPWSRRLERFISSRRMKLVRLPGNVPSKCESRPIATAIAHPRPMRKSARWGDKRTSRTPMQQQNRNRRQQKHPRSRRKLLFPTTRFAVCRQMWQLVRMRRMRVVEPRPIRRLRPRRFARMLPLLRRYLKKEWLPHHRARGRCAPLSGRR